MKVMERIKSWLFFNDGLLPIILVLSIVVIVYYQINNTRQVFDSRAYTETVAVENLAFKKYYSLDFNGTNQKLDKIVFDIDYEYKGEQYQSQTILYWEYVTPQFDKVLEEGSLEMLTVKCNKANPEQVMVFLEKKK